jgi:hypothetical protein
MILANPCGFKPNIYCLGSLKFRLHGKFRSLWKKAMQPIAGQGIFVLHKNIAMLARKPPGAESFK